MLQAANGKIMMLAAAKWREFSREDPNLTEQTPPSPPPAAAADPEKEGNSLCFHPEK